MKYIEKRKPTIEEIYRIHEILFFLIMENLQKQNIPITQQMYALSTLTETSSGLLVTAKLQLENPRIKPTKQEIAIALSYVDCPVRFIKSKIMHSRTYYNYVYEYFDTPNLHILKPLLPQDLTFEIIKFITNLRKYSDMFILSERKVTYG